MSLQLPQWFKSPTTLIKETINQVSAEGIRHGRTLELYDLIDWLVAHRDLEDHALVEALTHYLNQQVQLQAIETKTARQELTNAR